MAAKVKTDTAEGFVGSVAKFSIATFVNVGILALSILLTNWFIPKEAHGPVSLFLDYTNTIMTIAILGLDQALIRFYHEPPGKLSSNGLFRVSFYFSSAVLVIGGAICSTLLLRPVYQAIGITAMGMQVVPLVFLNAFFYMVARYFNVLYRMEMNIRVYTIQSILMQFFYKMFYLGGRAFGVQNVVTAMILCSVLGLGAFALVFGFMRRSVLRPRLAEFKPQVYKTTLPYGIAIAPTAIFVQLNYSLPKSYIGRQLSDGQLGLYSFALTLANVVSFVQLGFAAFWGAYMFENYKTQQERINKVHDFLNFVILVFFALLVAFEDVIFIILANFAEIQPIFPLMMLSAVFGILCEGTVYGNAIARRPIFDTLGFALSLGVNLAVCILLVNPLGLVGAAIALSIANFVMFFFRTLTAQYFYRTIKNPFKTGIAIFSAIVLAVVGTLWSNAFLLKLLACGVAIVFYCLIYRAEMVRCIQLGLSILKGLLNRNKV